MKLIKTLIILPILILAFVGCKDDDEDTPTLSGKNVLELTLSYDIKVSETLTFDASDNWTVSDVNNAMFSLSKTSGGAGKNSIVVKAKNYNCTNEDAHYSFTINYGNGQGTNDIKVNITHEPVFIVDSLNYEAKAQGDIIDVHVKSKALADPKNEIYVYFDSRSNAEEMVKNVTDDEHSKSQAKRVDGNMQYLGTVTPTRASKSSEEATFHVEITPNNTSSIRQGVIVFSVDKNKGMFSDCIMITQLPVNAYRSQDMSQDGKVTQIQKHKLGNGVPIVIMGDGFVDRDITSGKYRAATNKAIDGLFSLHPMKALKDYFDVYEVKAVSFNNYFTGTSSTAFSSRFISFTSTEIKGDDSRATEYAKKAIDEKRLDDAMIIVLLNDTRYAGTCAMYMDSKESDIPNGSSIAYVPLIESEEEQMKLSTVLCHEAVGHGFAKLADEYDNLIYEKISDDEKQYFISRQRCGGARNVAFDPDVTKSYWADFAADSRYNSERLGCYEGGATYALGVYRPTENSIMNDNIGGFNVAGRVMIYKRCMKIALGKSWKFNLADFITFDLENGKAASNKRNAPAKHSNTFKPLASPKVIIK